MYYLAKFCRICIQTDVKLMDIDTLDFDRVKLSEKLEICAKMSVGRESLSTEICLQCVTKLRISYQFFNMCKKSTQILQGYLAELIGPNKIDPEDFVNSDLTVAVTPLTHVNDVSLHRKKRISKGQRCSLLKKLLMPNNEVSAVDERIYKEVIHPYDEGGGLRNIINFTKNYEFNSIDNKSESTPLDKLTEFSKDFFRKDFTQFRETILYIIENKDAPLDSEDELFNSCDEEDEEDKVVKFEEVIIEPDIEIKKEMFEEEDEEYIKQEEMAYNQNNYDLQNNNSQSQSTMHLLDRLVEKYAHGHRRLIYSTSARCRTRNNPYINPMLQQQFFYKHFRCNKCDRNFKTPGYLKAHNSRLHSTT